MDFIRIQSSNNKYFKDIMNLYKDSFPIFEQRVLKDQLDVLKEDRYNCIAVCEKDKLVGLLFYWELENCKYIEHLAILTELRCKSYGSKILSEFCKSDKTIISEIDPPVDEISIKRLNFYTKLGFKLQEFNHIHPPYRKNYQGHNLKIMSHKKDLSYDEYNHFNDFLKNKIMKYSQVNS